MARKQEINQSAEIRSIVEQVGKDAKFKDVFAKLQANHKGHPFNENSCQQAFTLARKKLGFARSPNLKRVAIRTTRSSAGIRRPADTGTYAGNGWSDASGVLDIIRAAKQLIALTGSTRAAKEVVDTL